MVKPLVLVLTGGPCGGKSTALARLGKLFASRFGDITAYLGPEVATIMQSSGCRYPGTGPDKAAELLAFERSILQVQLSIEDSFKNIAAASAPARKTVVLLDRCAFDLVAYIGDDESGGGSELWRQTMAGVSPAQSEASLLARYDHVLFLQSAANGASEHYNLHNAARTESLEEARAMDAKTRRVFDARFGDRLHVFENGAAGGFEGKMQAVEACVDARIRAHFGL